ncbi:DUF748 domain-containing protein, partial [bacterium]|nr:DUF748 domain-containing protein [bacterium]
ITYDNELILKNSLLNAEIEAGQKNKELGKISSEIRFTLNNTGKKIHDFKLDVSKFDLKMLNTLCPAVKDKLSGLLSLESRLNTKSEKPNSIKNKITVNNPGIKGANMQELDSFLSQNNNISIDLELKNIFDVIEYEIGLTDIKYKNNKPSALKSIYLNSLNCSFSFNKENSYPKIEKLIINKPEITLQRLPQTSPSSDYSKSAAAPLLLIFVQNFNLTDGKLTFLDYTDRGILEFRFDRTNIEFSNLYYPSSKPVELRYSLYLTNTNGHIGGQINFIPQSKPINFKIDSVIENIPIIFFEPYYRDVVNVALDSGTISLHSKGQCENDNLFSKQDLSLRNLAINLERSSETIWHLNTKSVADLIQRKNGNLDLSFNYSANIRNTSEIAASIKNTLISSVFSIVEKEIMNIMPKLIENIGNKEKRGETLEELKQLGKNLFG